MDIEQERAWEQERIAQCERRKDRILRAVVVIYAGTDIIFRNTKADVEQIITTAFELERNISKRVDNGE